ncbi:hypothetical protein ACFYRL_30415 [Streptomyces goshikiensis]
MSTTGREGHPRGVSVSKTWWPDLLRVAGSLVVTDQVRAYYDPCAQVG